MSNVTTMRRPVAVPRQIGCSVCGATTDAACDCNAPYIPAGQRAAEAIAANPEKSDRAVAAEIGVDHKTVGAARKSVGEHSPPEKRIGQDGKSYPAKVTKPAPESVDDVDADVVEGEIPDIVDLYVETDTPGAAATNGLITSIAVFFEKLDPAFTKWLKSNPTEEAVAALDNAIFSYAKELQRRAYEPIYKRRKAYNKLFKAYHKRFGGNYLGENNAERMRLMEVSLETRVDQLVEVKATNRAVSEAGIEQSQREHEEFLRTPIDAETEQQYTSMIKNGRLYEGACMLSWPMYFKYREEHPELPSLTPDDLAYASMWTSCAVRQ